MPKPCPWCGHALQGDLTACPNCKWTRQKANTRPAILAYLFFIVLSAVLGFAAFRWVKNATPWMEHKPLDQITRPILPMRKPR